MADEGLAAHSSGPGMASSTDHEFSSHHQEPIITHDPPAATVSRKSTISKSQHDVHVTGTETPSSTANGHKNSKHMVELDEYFVGFLPMYGVQI
jgi:hypothetical protein